MIYLFDILTNTYLYFQKKLCTPKKGVERCLKNNRETFLVLSKIKWHPKIPLKQHYRAKVPPSLYMLLPSWGEGVEKRRQRLFELFTSFCLFKKKIFDAFFKTKGA